jgi:spore coat protein U-like protein
VNAKCTITAGSVAFGVYDPLTVNSASGSDLAASGTVDVACSKNTSALITLAQGSNPAGGSTCLAPARRMSDGTDNLAYGLFQDAGLTTAWGCDVANDMAYLAASKAPVTKTIYGNIPKDQDVENGAYADTVVATITF